MAKAATKESGRAEETTPSPSKNMVREYASNEFVFAVVGHVGSGTTKIATSLSELLSKGPVAGDSFDTEIIKARELIEGWATENKKALPNATLRDLKTTELYQDLGDEMRATGDHAAVANRAIQRIRLVRAQKQKMENPGDKPVEPDGSRRAYIVDSIRHPAEVELLRRVYREAFVLIGVVCDAEVRLTRLQSGKYSSSSKDEISKFMERDSRASEDYGQRVSDAFHMADYFVDNTAPQLLDNGKGNPEWDINDNLSRLTKIITHTEVVRPTIAETAMHEAYGASLRSACLSRQVGAALLDKEGNIIGTGTNEVPKAGGGVYGEHFDDEDDFRCAFRESGKFCSNTQEQNRIIDEIFDEVEELADLNEITKRKRKAELRKSRVGDLIEFSRAVHAEMDALLSAARKGTSTIGTRLFVTTFPCHSCARGIVTAGVDEVQYIEPYPKSLALKLHSDAITIGRKEPDGTRWLAPSDGGSKVRFSAFTGVAPRLYRRAFLKDRSLKNSLTGAFAIGPAEWGTAWDIHKASYFELEAALAKAR
jgi:deoxycytidylate deaminase